MKKSMKHVLLVSLFIGTLTISGCSIRRTNVNLLTNNKLKTVKTKRNFDNILENSEQHSYDKFVVANDAVPTTTELQSTSVPQEGGRDFVGTNLQDEAVDEAEIIKTNGEDIYYISQGTNKLTVFSVLDTHEIITKHEIVKEGVQFSEMYLLDDYVVALGIESTHVYTSGGYWMPYYYEKSILLVYDINTMTEVYSLAFNYNVVTTRLINRSLYIVGDKNLYYGRDIVLPTFVENSSEDYELSYDDIYYFDETLVYGMTLLGGIYLDKDATKINYNVEGYLGATHRNKKVYVSENNLYISDSNYYFDRYSAYTSLSVSQFALKNESATTTFVSAATLRGAALNQFAMDEYDGYLRVATTDMGVSWRRGLDGEIKWESFKQTVNNYLYILKLDNKTKKFNLIAHISEGLGKPDETIRSVRFDGEKAYIVTFLQTDPLYVIDLSNPKSPRITDAIMLPGFDTYQHPWGENSLIGIGYNATESGVITGTKISAYNTTSGSASELQTRPIDVSIEGVYNSNYVYSEALSNHKALLVSPRHNIIGMPLHSYVSTERDGYYWGWSYYFEYIVFAIDFSHETPISVLTRITHEENIQEYNPIRRAILIENHIYTFSNNKVVTFDITNNLIKENVLSF